MGRKLIKALLSFLELQLFITLFSWPILLYWGLPISIASPVGNLIFTPFITVFLAVSTLIFFSEILFIPNGFLVTLLEYITTFWYWAVGFSYKSWLLYLPKPSLLFLLLLPTCACTVIFYKKINNSQKRILSLSFLLFFSLGYLKFSQTQNIRPIETINYFDNNLTLLRSSNKTILIDPGALGKNNSATTWVKYSLIPNLIKTGITKIDYLIILKPSTTIFKALVELCKNFNIIKLHLISWEGKLSHSGWQAWEQLLAQIKENNIEFKFLDQDTQITLSNTEKISLTVHELIKKNNLKYRKVKASISQHQLEICTQV